MSEELKQLQAIHDQAKKDGLLVRFWCNGVLVLAVPQHAAPDTAVDLKLQEGL